MLNKFCFPYSQLCSIWKILRDVDFFVHIYCYATSYVYTLFWLNVKYIEMSTHFHKFHIVFPFRGQSSFVFWQQAEEEQWSSGAHTSYTVLCLWNVKRYTNSISLCSCFSLLFLVLFSFYHTMIVHKYYAVYQSTNYCLAVVCRL